MAASLGSWIPAWCGTAPSLSSALSSQEMVPGSVVAAALGDELDLLVTEGLIVSLEGGTVLLAAPAKARRERDAWVTQSRLKWKVRSTGDIALVDAPPGVIACDTDRDGCAITLDRVQVERLASLEAVLEASQSSR